MITSFASLMSLMSCSLDKETVRVYIYIFVVREFQRRERGRLVSPAMEGCSSQMLKQETKEEEKELEF